MRRKTLCPILLHSQRRWHYLQDVTMGFQYRPLQVDKQKCTDYRHKSLNGRFRRHLASKTESAEMMHQ